MNSNNLNCTFVLPNSQSRFGVAVPVQRQPPPGPPAPIQTGRASVIEPSTNYTTTNNNNVSSMSHSQCHMSTLLNGNSGSVSGATGECITDQVEIDVDVSLLEDSIDGPATWATRRTHQHQGAPTAPAPAPAPPAPPRAVPNSNSKSIPIPTWVQGREPKHVFQFLQKITPELDHLMEQRHLINDEDETERIKAQKIADFNAKMAELDQQIAEKEALVRNKKEKLNVKRAQLAAEEENCKREEKQMAAKSENLSKKNQRLKLAIDEAKYQTNILANGILRILKLDVLKDQTKAFCPEPKVVYSQDPKEIQCDYWNCSSIPKFHVNDHQKKD